MCDCEMPAKETEVQKVENFTSLEMIIRFPFSNCLINVGVFIIIKKITQFIITDL